MNSLNFGYWLFSTLVQAMAALFAVVGVFIVFRIQILNERLRPLMEAAKRTYKYNRRIVEDDSSEEYRKLLGYYLNEMIDKFHELITEKRKALEKKENLLEEAKKIEQEKPTLTLDIRRIKKNISDCENKLRALEKINQNLKNIKEKGMSSLRKIGVVFVFSLFWLFFNPFILQEKLIIAMGILAVVYTLITVVHIIRIIKESLNIEQD